MTKKQCSTWTTRRKPCSYLLLLQILQNHQVDWESMQQIFTPRHTPIQQYLIFFAIVAY